MNQTSHSALRPAVVSLLAFTAITLAYTLAVTGISHIAFPWRANGSMIVVRDTVRGSELIAQPFAEPRYFWPRPSATSPAYNAAASSGSNLGPTNPALRQAVQERVAALRAADPGNVAPIPADLVTASGSGQDPHISPAAAGYQASRVARARAADAAQVRDLVVRHTAGSVLGVLGEPRVNVLRLNLALDSALGDIR